jgi:hypothetical protein
MNFGRREHGTALRGVAGRLGERGVAGLPARVRGAPSAGEGKSGSGGACRWEWGVGSLTRGFVLNLLASDGQCFGDFARLSAINRREKKSWYFFFLEKVHFKP